MSAENLPERQVLVCQSKTCCKQNAVKVLSAFKADPVPGVAIVASGCLGQCGNGPMVLVQPDQIWYGAVHPEEVSTVVEQHLRRRQPVKQMFYRKLSPDK